MKLRPFLSLSVFSFLALVSFSLPKLAHADFSDTFTDTNGTDITTHNSDYHYSTGDSGVTIQSNAIAPNNETVQITNHNFADGCMSMDWSNNSNNTNMTIRGNNEASAFYQLWSHNNNGDWALNAYYSGSSHTLASGNVSNSGSHTYKICAIGSLISAYRDGSLLGSATDTNITANAGQSFTSDGQTLDNLKLGY